MLPLSGGDPLEVGQWLILGFDPLIKKYGHCEILYWAEKV